MKNIFSVVVIFLLLGSLLSASSVSSKVDESSKVNAKLEKSAIVCKSKKSLQYLLKSRKNYQNVVNGLVSNSIYKNCFLSIVAADVTVAAHYSDENLIKNYYVINKHTDKTRYVPIEFIKPIHSTKKSTRKYYKKNKKKYKKSTKKYYKKRRKKRERKKSPKLKKSKAHKPKKTSITIKKNNTNTVVKKTTTSQTVAKTMVSPEVTNKIEDKTEQKNHLKSIVSSDSEPKKNISSNDVLTQKKDLGYMKVYRCTAVSVDESFRGEHIDKEESTKMALENCKKYQKNESTCILESCFILRIDLQ